MTFFPSQVSQYVSQGGNDDLLEWTCFKISLALENVAVLYCHKTHWKLLSWVLQRFEEGTMWGSHFYHRPGTLRAEELLQIFHVSTDWKYRSCSSRWQAHNKLRLLRLPQPSQVKILVFWSCWPWSWFCSGKWRELQPRKGLCGDSIQGRRKGGSQWRWVTRAETETAPEAEFGASLGSIETESRELRQDINRVRTKLRRKGVLRWLAVCR